MAGTRGFRAVLFILLTGDHPSKAAYHTRNQFGFARKNITRAWSTQAEAVDAAVQSGDDGNCQSDGDPLAE